MPHLFLEGDKYVLSAQKTVWEDGILASFCLAKHNIDITCPIYV